MSYPHAPHIREAIIARILAGEKIPKISAETGVPIRTIRMWGEKRGAPTTGTIATNLGAGKTVMGVPDLHCPFEHQDALPFLREVKIKYEPDLTVFLGDEVDFHAMSRYPHDPNGHSAGHELREAIDHLIPFYREFPQVMVCESNHTIRGHKAAFQSGLPAAFLNHIATVLNAPDGWKWANHWEIDGVRYIHGDAGRSGQYAHMAYLKMFKQNLVIGHIHSFAGINYEGPFWAVNSGCLIDEDKYAFSYARNMPIRPNLGCTIVFGGRWAVFVPMILNNEGRWIGTL